MKEWQTAEKYARECLFSEPMPNGINGPGRALWLWADRTSKTGAVFLGIGTEAEIARLEARTVAQLAYVFADLLSEHRDELRHARGHD